MSERKGFLARIFGNGSTDPTLPAKQVEAVGFQKGEIPSRNPMRSSDFASELDQHIRNLELEQQEAHRIEQERLEQQREFERRIAESNARLFRERETIIFQENERTAI